MGVSDLTRSLRGRRVLHRQRRADNVAPFGAPSKPVSKLGSPQSSFLSCEGRLEVVRRSPVAVGPREGSFQVEFDPQPDWGLAELQHELEIIGGGLNESSLLREVPVSEEILSKCVSWRSLKETYKWQSASFRIGVSDDDCYVSEGEEEVVSKLRIPDSELEDGSERCADPASPVEVVSPFRWRSPVADNNHLLQKTKPEEAALLDLDTQRRLRVQEEARQSQQNLTLARSQEHDRKKAAHFQVDSEAREKLKVLVLKDEDDSRSIAEARDQHLCEVQREHEQRSQVEERKIRNDAAVEEARRQQVAANEERARKAAEKAAAERREKQQAEAAAELREKQQAEAAAAAAAAEKQKQLDAKQKDLEAKQNPLELKQTQEASQLAKPAANETVATVGRARISPKAAALEQARMTVLLKVEEECKLLLSNPALKKDVKLLERNVIKILQQVSATQEQVRKKSLELTQLMQSPNIPQSLLFMTLANKLLSQCESQVLKLPTFAFPLAQVVVNVASEVSSMMDVVIGRLNQVCIFTVPKYYIYRKENYTSDEHYYKTLGYKVEDNKLESTDEYVARMSAYMTFYAAITQTQVASGKENPYGLAFAWTWCGSLLNALPANRLTASALEAMLKIAGYRMVEEFKGQFMKILNTIGREFLVSLKKKVDPDSRAVVTRLETYLQTQQYTKEPEGRKMPVTDVSSTLSMRA